MRRKLYFADSAESWMFFFARGLYAHVFFLLALLLCSLMPFHDALAARHAPAGQIQDALSCKPFLDWMIDPGGKLSIQDISSPERQNIFAPLDTGFPPHQSGTLWLRLTMEPRPLESRLTSLLLDMGNGVPGTPLLFSPKNSPFANTAEWQDIQQSRQSIFLLPDALAIPQTVYIRMDGLPSPWFTPMLRTAHNAATNLERMVRPAILAALAAVMLLCLLRGLTERGQWRIWTGLYTGAAFAYAVYGMPDAPDGMIPMRELPGVLAPGIALMLLPHVGRHLLRTRDKARALDIQYLLLSLPGAALALLPLMPGFAWSSYYLALWPLATVLFVPTSLGAWLCGLPGARRFLLACLASTFGAIAGILGMYVFVSSPFLSVGPLLGVTLGALLIAGMAVPKEYEPEAGKKTSLEQLPEDMEESGLRLVPPEEAAAAQSADLASQLTVAPQIFSARDGKSCSSLEECLRPHLDALLYESAGINLCALPPAARQHAEAILNSGRAMASLLGNAMDCMTLERSPERTVFNLQQILRGIHDQLADEAERKGLSISWFMPPHLPQYYSGNAKGISQVIRLLLESSIRATQQGFVQLMVRRMPESVDPGHLLFSISDSGSGMPPHTRASHALSRAWELAGAQGGGLSAESGTRGTTVSFTIHLTPHSASQMEADITEQANRVIIIDELSSNRQLLAFFLEGLPCVVQEARTVEEAVQTRRTECATLLLVVCDMPKADNFEALRMLLDQEREQGLPETPVLAIESENTPWPALGELENVHRISRPVTRTELRGKVLELLSRPCACLTQEAACAQHEDDAPDSESPLDLPPPVEYGPGHAPAEEQFVPLSMAPAISDGNIFVRNTAPQPMPFPDFPPEMAWKGEAAAPAAMAPAQESVYQTPFPLDDAEWVGEPTPITPSIQERASLLRPFDRQAARVGESDADEEGMAHPQTPFSASRQGGLLDWVEGARVAQAAVPQSTRAVPPAAYAASSHYAYQDLEEWVGEPTPIPRAESIHKPRAFAPLPLPGATMGISREPSQQKFADTRETRSVTQESAISAAGMEWVGEPEPISTARAALKPTQNEFIPLRLTGAHQPAPTQSSLAAPEIPADAVSLFPEDKSLLGFVLGRSGKDNKQSEKKGHLSPDAQPETQRAEPRSFMEQPEAAAFRKMDVFPVEQPAHAMKAVEQMQPLIPGLLASLDDAMIDVRRGFNKADTIAVEEAAARIAARADNYGLRILARMARCVEMAARARDKEALANILPDLETAVERNRIALQPKK